MKLIDEKGVQIILEGDFGTFSLPIGYFWTNIDFEGSIDVRKNRTTIAKKNSNTDPSKYVNLKSCLCLLQEKNYFCIASIM